MFSVLNRYANAPNERETGALWLKRILNGTELTRRLVYNDQSICRAQNRASK